MVVHTLPTEIHVEAKEGMTLPVASMAQIHEVPKDWRHTPVSQLTSLEIRPGECTVKIDAHVSSEYIQVCCRPHCSSIGDECSVNDSANALKEILVALKIALSKGPLSTYLHASADVGVEGGKHECPLEKALYVHVLLQNMDHFAATNAEYCRHFPSMNPPSRACVQVPLPQGCPLLVDVLVARDSRKALHQQQPGAAQPKKVLHVQSISDWAPSCIGPYSQVRMAPPSGSCARLARPPVQSAPFITHTTPYIPQSDTTCFSCDPVAQLHRAIASAEAVAIGMRSSVLRASLGLTVYVAACVGADGLEAVQAAVTEILAKGEIPPSPAPPPAYMPPSTVVAGTPLDNPSAAPAAPDSLHGLSPWGSVDESVSSDEEGQPDTYLEAAKIRAWSRSNL
eukprot:gene24632-10253_t